MILIRHFEVRINRLNVVVVLERRHQLHHRRGLLFVERGRRLPADVRKWMARSKAEGIEGLKDRSTRPHRLHRPTPIAIIERVEVLRRQRWTGRQIAVEVGVSPATVSRILKRLGLNRLAALEPAEPVRRYEREHPGELIHIDIKKLGRFDRVGHRITGDRRGHSNSRGVGWEFVHVCIDDASRVRAKASDEIRRTSIPASIRRQAIGL